MRKIPFIICLFTGILHLSNTIRDQSIAVKGRLLCGTAPATSVRVKLFDEDTGKINILE